MKTLQRLTGALVLGLVLGLPAFADDPLTPPDNCGHMETDRCSPTGSSLADSSQIGTSGDISGPSANTVSLLTEIALDLLTLSV
jgi:hypothetical protein